VAQDTESSSVTGLPPMHSAYFTIAFCTLLTQLALVSLAPSGVATDSIDLLATIVLAWVGSGITGRKRDFWILLAVGCGAPLLDLVAPLAAAPFAVNVAKDILWLAFPLILAQRLFMVIYRADKITHQELSGAITVYLLIGIFFASLFELFHLFDPNAIQWGSNFSAGAREFGDFVYFSFVTMASVGYGDVAPASPLTRITVVFEAVVGLMYLAILIARFVTMHSVRARSGPSGNE